MNRVLIIGIDAMDAALLSHFQGETPYLNRLKEAGSGIPLTSVFPPDTPTAWATIYTGLNPARHGLVYFVDPLEKATLFTSKDLDNSALRGKTFWDIASRAGKRVCVLFPQLGYPVWEVNGVMVGKSTSRYNKGISPMQSYPRQLGNSYDLSPLARIKAVPQRKLFPKYIEAYRRLLEAEISMGLKLWREEDWDLFFIYSEALDWVGHNLWSYFDEHDPDYPGENSLKDAFAEFYRRYDDMVGQFLTAAGTDTTVIVLSDHGLTRRPSKSFNVNELLRSEGLLAIQGGSAGSKAAHSLVETAKRQAVRVFNKYGAGNTTMRLVHHLPAFRRMFTLPQAIDWAKTVAYASDLSGIKAYSYGGIVINRTKLSGRDYEELRQDISHKLLDTTDPGTNKRLVKWACRREELYEGQYSGKYPDILFQLEDEYGTGWAVPATIVSKSATHSISPGCHRADSPVLFIHGASHVSIAGSKATLMDIAPTVLDLLRVEGNGPCDGRSLLAAGGR